MCKYHFHPQHFGIRHEQSRTDGVDMQDVRPHPPGFVDGTESMDDGLKRLFLGRRKRDEPNTLPLLQAILHIIGASHHCHVPSSFRQAREQFLTMRLHPTHDTGYAAGTGYHYFLHFIIRIENNSLLLHANTTTSRTHESICHPNQRNTSICRHSIVDVPFCPLALADRQKETLNTLRGYLRTII